MANLSDNELHTGPVTFMGALYTHDLSVSKAAVLGVPVRNLYLVPTLYHDLLGHADFGPDKVRSVRKLGFAGAAMPEGLLKRVDAAFRPELFVNHYGSSEIYTFTIDQQAAKKPGSAGKAGINERIRVIRLAAESADELAGVGEEGEVIADLLGDEAFEGYWRRSDADARALRKGWYFTGDTGYLDEAGRVESDPVHRRGNNHERSKV